jgi:hypothetical protein
MVVMTTQDVRQKLVQKLAAESVKRFCMTGFLEWVVDCLLRIKTVSLDLYRKCSDTQEKHC